MIYNPSFPDLNPNLLVPTSDESVPSNYSIVVPRSYIIASGKKLVLGANARFRIL